MFESRRGRRDNYLTNIPFVFAATADFYYAHWGEFFHLAIFEEGDDPADWDGAFERTHQRYFAALRGAQAGRILELASGGGAFAAWMAQRTEGEVLGVDISPVQLRRARHRLERGHVPNLRFVEHDVMKIAELDEPPFDAAVFMDAACYLPDKAAAVAGIATRLRSGARFLLIDWCRPEQVTALQQELILEPFYRAYCIPEMETINGYERALEAAGFSVVELEDLSPRVTSSWERGYWEAVHAVEDPLTLRQLASLAKSFARQGRRAVRLAKAQFNAAILSRLAADAGLLRYVYILAERS